jgi:hypothetical protein
MADDNETDGPEIDEETLNEMREAQDDSTGLSPEELFALTTIDKLRKKKVHVEIQDSEGATIQLKDIVQELLNYIKVKTKDQSETNQFIGQIMPLMSQAVVSGLGRMLGIRQTAFYLADPETRYAFINMMCVSFLMLKFVQQKNLVINTYEEEVTDEQIEDLDRKSKANSVAMLGALAGQDPKAILEELKKTGAITDRDLREILGDTNDSVLQSDRKPAPKN